MPLFAHNNKGACNAKVKGSIPGNLYIGKNVYSKLLVIVSAKRVHD